MFVFIATYCCIYIIIYYYITLYHHILFFSPSYSWYFVLKWKFDFVAVYVYFDVNKLLFLMYFLIRIYILLESSVHSSWSLGCRAPKGKNVFDGAFTSNEAKTWHWIGCHNNSGTWEHPQINWDWKIWWRRWGTKIKATREKNLVENWDKETLRVRTN
jgi:hypothetical protein